MKTQVHFIQNALTFSSERQSVFYILKIVVSWKSYSRLRNSQKATAEAAATLSESTPCAMGIRTT